MFPVCSQPTKESPHWFSHEEHVEAIKEGIGNQEEEKKVSMLGCDSSNSRKRYRILIHLPYRRTGFPIEISS